MTRAIGSNGFGELRLTGEDGWQIGIARIREVMTEYTLAADLYSEVSYEMYFSPHVRRLQPVSI